MKTLDIILYVVSAACFLLCVPGSPVPTTNFRFYPLALGLLAWVLVPLIALARS